MRAWAALVIAVLAGAQEVPPHTVQVQLQQGTIEGSRSQEVGEGRYYFNFRNIPYAEPPVGPLRFKDPVPDSGWEGVRNGSTYTIPCTQFDMATFVNNTPSAIGLEDCLYLNVHTPRPSESDLPVLVWIHMGGFTGGASSMYQPMPFLTKDLVLVTIEYRLNVAGFLSTEDSVLSGNLGLKDQVLALRWVQDNINKFGGDPNQVTLAGDEAGGSSVHYHILSPMSEGLFQRAIIHSGSAVAPAAYREDHRLKALQLGKLMDCVEDEVTSELLDTAAMIDCLRDIPIEELVKAQWSLGATFAYPYVMVPGIDGDFLPDHPAKLLKEGRYNKVDILTGAVRDQGASMALAFLKFAMNITYYPSAPAIYEALGFYDWDNNPVYLTNRAYYNYFQGPVEYTIEKADILEKLYGDSIYKQALYDTIDFHVHDAVFGNKVFAYELQHQGKISFMAGLYGPTPDFAKNWIFLEDDMPYLFEYWLTPKVMSNPEDLFVREIMLEMWTSFVINGHPTPDGSLGFTWEEVDGPDINYLSITTTPTMKTVDTKVREFWKKMPTKMHQMLYPAAT